MYQEWIRENLGCDPRLVAEQMCKFVLGGGRIKRIPEQGNAEDYDNEFHDDLEFVFRKKAIFVETIFHEDRHPDGCYIEVVSVKPDKK